MGWLRAGRQTTIRARVRLLVIACIVPVWLLAGLVAYFAYERERDNIASATVQTARSLTQGLERELAMSVAVLQTLATASQIDEGDLAGFRERAQQTLLHSAGDMIALFDTQSQLLMITAQPAGTVFPKIKTDRLTSVVATGQPAVSDYYVGELSKRPQIVVAVPVVRKDKVVGRLDMVFSPERFARFLKRQGFSPDWTVSVLDSQGVIVARSRAAEQFVGKSATAALLAQLKQRSEGSYATRTSEGIEVIACFSRSGAYGWAVAVGIPEAQFAAELKRTLGLFALGGLALLALGLALANWIGRHITNPIAALVEPALAIGRGETASIDPSSLREAADLGAALASAQALLGQRAMAREQAEASLRDSQARLRMVLDVSQIGEWELELGTGAVTHSMRHDQCFGYAEPVADWTVETFFSHLHPDERERGQTQFAELRSLGESRQRDFRVIWPDGSLHWIASQATVLKVNGVPAYIVGLVIDITDRKQTEELRLHGVRLESENRQIQESNRVKSEFLANMSHELRTPLNAIIGFADILRSQHGRLGSEQQQAYLGHVASSGRHLLQLINDVLDLSKVESGKFEFFPVPTDLPLLVREVTGVLHAEAARKGITLLTEHDPDLLGLVLDPSRLKQMLYNFLSNAIKFTESGGRVVLRTFRQGTEQLRIEVEDTGIGIALADQGKLFTQFQQLRPGYAKPQQGTGLGLALTRRLAELQGGSVGVRSTPGVGSVFFLVLPRLAIPEGSGPGSAATFAATSAVASASSPGPVIAPDSKPAPAALPGAPKVLVIEDEVADQAKLVRILNSAGFQVDLAANGEQALQLARDQLYDAITLDLLLPDRSGLDVLATLRAGGQNSQVPVVVVTLVTETATLAGFQISDMLTKPIRPDEIIGAFRRAGLLTADAPRVLVVDDDPAALELMAATLKAQGMTALCVSDGASALAFLDSQQPDAVVLDLLMPGLNGFDLLHALRERHDKAYLPVFVWTSMTLSPEQLATLSRTAQAVFDKGQGGIDRLAGHLHAWRQTQGPANAPKVPAA